MQIDEFKKIRKPSPKIGFGAWGIGGITTGATSYGPIEKEIALECISQAYKAGMRFFDTSPAYGNGKSEARLGHALEQHRDNVIFATKGGISRFEGTPDFSTKALKQGIEESLIRLRTDYIDIYQLHNPPNDVISEQPKLAALLDRLKQEGKASLIGISVKSPTDAVKLLATYPFDTIQVNFNMLDLRALECGLLDHCAQKNISVIARTPLCFGFLSLSINETTSFDQSDHRSNWSIAQKKLWSFGAQLTQKIAADHDTVEATPVARALRFCLSHPAVQIVLTGPMTACQALENAEVTKLPPLSSSCLNAIASLHKQQSFYTNTS